MKANLLKIFLLLFIITGTAISQQQETITVTGGKQVHHTINGESIDTVYGPVTITQGNVIITCDKAVRYVIENNAELIGHVVVRQDTLTITTDHGFYYGDERKAESNSGVKLTDKKVILTADSGDYFFDLDKAVFKSRVTLIDTSSVLTSSRLIYFKNEGKAIASGSVKIVESQNIIKADSLIHFRESKISYAFNDVRITNTTNNTKIFGDHLEDYPNTFYTLIDKNPILVQVDTSYENKIDTLASGNVDTSKVIKLDTLIIKCMKMEAYRDTINIFKAEDSVKIVRGSFASRNDFSKYFRNEGKIITEKIKQNSAQPIIWYENSQLTGDSVTIFLHENKINLMDVDKDAFIVSNDEKYPSRYSQISGDKFIIHFGDDGIEETEVYGKVYSIYYLYDDNSPNGLVKSSSQTAKIFFKDKKVDQVKLYGTPTSEYYPEVKVQGNELAFTLPGFVLYKNKPDKKELLESIAVNADQDASSRIKKQD